MSKGKASIVFYSGESNQGSLHKVEELYGHCVHSITSFQDKVYGVTSSIVFDITESKELPISDVINMSSGKSHVVALTNGGQLYTWGSGESGELGQGSRLRELKVPKKIVYEAKFVDISCGDNHTCAIDARGNMYSWGQNFDRQLGLYKKSEKALPPQVHVENVIMAPKFLPFSLLHPIKVIACGSRFTVALTQEGQVWTWGAGESGQLGTGKFSKRDCPSALESVDDVFVSIACGFAHVVGSTEGGSLYSWGLNAKGQLGHNDIAARALPEKVTGVSRVSKVYASDHSSAYINSVGELFTWGSGKYYRLMNGDPSSHVLAPSHVSVLSGNIVDKFAFATTQSLALVFTKALKLYPTSGPQKTFSRLEIHGCGFWPSKNIVVKFLKLSDDETSLPRSCLGKYESDNVISCKPPKLSDLGWYRVSLSLNGTDFLSDVLKVEINPDPICNSLVSPHVFNARLSEIHFCDIVVDASRLAKTCTTEGVYVQLTDSMDSTKKPLVVKGRLETDEERDARLDVTDNSQSEPADSVLQRVMCDNVDLTTLFEPVNHPYCMVVAQVSNSMQDFSEPSPEKILVHYFHVFDIEPQCCPTSGQREIQVHGSSIPSTSLHIEAVIGLSQGVKNGVETFLEIKVPTRTDDEKKLCFTIPPVEDIFKKNKKSVPPHIDFYSVEISFRLPNDSPLQDAAFQFNYYREQPITVYPRAVRLTGGTRLTISSNYIQFISDEAKISFVDRVSSNEKEVTFSEFKKNSGQDEHTYSIECVSPSFAPTDDDDGDAGYDDIRQQSDKVFIGLLLDGISRPVDSFLFEASFFDAVVVDANISKAPLSVGATVTASASGLVESDICVIRIRSPVTRNFVEVQGEINADCTGLVFVIPEAVKSIFPGDNSKWATYYVDVCIDGTTFDEQKSPGLQIKHL